jgi:hypothetical protein
MKTSELTGAALDWAVHVALHGSCEGYAEHEYSTDWSQGGPIIEREGITLSRNEQKSFVGQQPWVSYLIEHLFMDEYEHEYQYGPTPLIAAMRCYVASKLGDEIDLPKELT